MGKIVKTKYFSLIELLVVIAITGILISIGMPAFNSLMKGQNVEQSARTIGSILKSVRSYAITSRQYAALIIPTNETTLPSSYLYKSFRPCVIDSSNNFLFWVQDEKWEFMNTGTAILDIDDTSGYDTGSFAFATEVDNVNFSSIGGSISVNSVVGVVFQPTGQTSGATKYVIVGDSTILDGSVSINYIDIIIDQYTGRISYGNK